MSPQISFSVEDPVPYHTVEFHRRRAVRQQINRILENPENRSDLFMDLLIELRRLLQIGDAFSLLLMPAGKFPDPGKWPGKDKGIILDFSGTDTDPNNSMWCVQTGKLPVYPLDSAGSQKTVAMDSEDVADVFLGDTDILRGSMINTASLTRIRSLFANARLHIDISISLMTGRWDLNAFESFMFNTKFIFGMSPGLILWLVKKEMLPEIQSRFPDRNDWQTFNNGDAPNLVHRETDWSGVYVFSKVCEDMAKRDPMMISNESVYKSITLYNVLDAHNKFRLPVENDKLRSPAVLCSTTLMSAETLDKIFSGRNIRVDLLRRAENITVLRIANFPAHSREQVEWLADHLESI